MDFAATSNSILNGLANNRARKMLVPFSLTPPLKLVSNESLHVHDLVGSPCPKTLSQPVPRLLSTLENIRVNIWKPGAKTRSQLNRKFYPFLASYITSPD